MAEQPRADPRILDRDDIGQPQYLRRTGSEVTKVADRPRDDIKPRFKTR